MVGRAVDTGLVACDGEDMIWALQRQALPFPKTLQCTEVVCVAAQLGLLSKHWEALVDLGGPG